MPPAAVREPGAIATVQAQPAQPPVSTLVVPFDTPVGVAAFRRGNVALIVIDQPLQIDITPLRKDPVFGSASVQTLPAATVIRVRLDAGMALSMSKTAHAWRIAAAAVAPKLRPIPAVLMDNRLALSAAAPGTVVTIADPDTGTTLLVGTQLQDGQGVPARRRSTQFALLPTWQGVAVEAIADTLALRATQLGFVLSGGAEGLDLSPTPDAADLLAHADGLTRQFDFPSLPAETLLQRLRRQVTEDATTRPLARGPKRQAVARTMIALGLGAEAQAVLQLAVVDDPQAAASPTTAALASIAALLAHRPEDATGLTDPRLSGADDMALWRGVRRAELDNDPASAAAIALATLPLLLSYPAGMRDRILPLVAETLVAGGEIATAVALLDARKDDARLDTARGMLQEARGDSAGALATYDRLAQSRDQSVHARAAVHAVELRLASGGIDAKHAADQMDALLYAWRGDPQERLVREHLAALRARTGEWRTALGLLRETEAVFPDDAAAIHGELTDMFTAVLRGDAADTLAPLELVALVEENADLLPGGADGDALQAKLADRLLALDLPKRAGPVLEKLMLAAPTAVGRAGFGARLAALRLREDDAAGAIAALSASQKIGAESAGGISSSGARWWGGGWRSLGRRRCGVDGAEDVKNSVAADEARATILERANNWPAAEKALTDYAAKSVPSEGKLDDGQRRTLLRLATAAARAGDDARLSELRQRDTTRMATGALADMFRLLTAEQVQVVADLEAIRSRRAVLARDFLAQFEGASTAGAADAVAGDRRGTQGRENTLLHAARHFPMFRGLGPRERTRFRASYNKAVYWLEQGCAMDALSPLGMVSDNPSEFHTESGAEAQKDYFVQKDGVKFAGTHLLLDLWGAENLTDPALIDRALRDAAEAANATILHSHFHHFGPDGGVSGVVVLAESHISIHTWPERDFAAVDIFMCGACDPYRSLPVLKEVFRPKSILLSEQRRGLIA